MVRTVYICITIYGIIIDSIVSHRKTTEFCELAHKIVYVLNTKVCCRVVRDRHLVGRHSSSARMQQEIEQSLLSGA